MRCQRCGKSISPLRQLTDCEFCCEEHRRRGALASASGLREIDYDGGGVYLESEAKREQKSSAVSGAALGVILLAGAALLLAAKLWLPQSTPETVIAGQNLTSPVEGLRSRAPVVANRFAEWVDKRLPGERAVKLDWSVKSGLDEWTSSLGGQAWQRAGSRINPGSLRLWRPTLDRQDYDLTFTGIIEKKALSVAYRASAENYYAAKLKLSKPGQISGASIARLVVSGGKVIDEMELPLPVMLKTGHAYQIQVSATQNMFATYLDGNLVDEWHDKRFKKGGVGFFNDPGEISSISDVSFRERKGLLSRFFATFFYMPTGLTLF
ncbi:MAG TPA: hypothetical protein PLZ95_07460 [Bryobacteraceae bacterium]|nr:hypothetical protein [Bryobacteraceae bacterium]